MRAALAYRFGHFFIFRTSAAGTLPLAKAISYATTQSQSLQDAVLYELLVDSAIALAVTALATVGLGWLMAARVLRPVHRITATARRLSRETLGERIALEGPRDELEDLADTFDAMLDRLQAAFESQHRLVANASHELRTPLAVQLTLIDVALRDPAAGTDDLRATLEQLRANWAVLDLFIAQRPRTRPHRPEHRQLAQMRAARVAQTPESLTA